MSPKKTSLYPVHEKLGASFTDFGGWDTTLPSTKPFVPAPVFLTSLTWVSSV